MVRSVLGSPAAALGNSSAGRWEFTEEGLLSELRGVNQTLHVHCEQDDNMENVFRKEENPFCYT